MQQAEARIEQLPGEAGEHRVLKTEPSQLDDMPEVTVPQGHVFVLGDNRNRAADSRVPRDQLGAGMVQLSAIIGRPMYIHWSRDHARVGQRLEH